MQIQAHRRNVAATVMALAFAGLAILVGGGWGIVIADGAAALQSVVHFFRNMTQGGDGDDGNVGC